MPVLGVLGIALWLSPLALAMNTQPLPSAAELFEIHCAGCHPQGGNIIRRNKTLKQAALQRHHLDSQTAIAQLITQGKNNMSAFQDRLSAAQIEQVAAYVREQAAQGWP